MKYAWIKENAKQFPTAVMCRVLQVSDSGYYGYLDREPCAAQKRREAIGQAAAKFYFESNRVYGYRKVHGDIMETEMQCSPETVRRIMRRTGLFSRIKRKFIITTDSCHQMAVAENILDRDFSADGPNQKWAADITYISTAEGWLYFAAVMDLFSRKIVGWSMSEHIDTALVTSAMRMAVSQRKPQAGLLHHSDRGCQYASEEFRDLLSDHGIICSMSRKGNCWDNACMESFFGSLKNEWLSERKYKTREEAIKDVFEYVEMFYNRKRRHESLGYLSPAAYEKRYEKEQKQVA